MARPLLSIVPLLLSSTAAASPPVPATRVTGNVSTEHHTRRETPRTNPCRVTGNIVRRASKAPPTCTITAPDDTMFSLRSGTFEQAGDTCTASGEWQEGPVCALSDQAGSDPVLVPEKFVTSRPKS